MATRAAYNEFRRVYSDPSGARRAGDYDERAAHYALLWAYHENSAFDDLSAWAAYRARHRLYRFQRNIYNPVRRLVDFYVSVIYQGAWPITTSDMMGKTSAVPFADDSDPEMLEAISQFWEWSNWPAKSAMMLRYGAALGDVLVLLVDDVQRGKVYADVLYPGHVSAVTLNTAGDVISYVLEYEIDDGDDLRRHTYRRDVDKEMIRTFRDDRPWDYDGQGAERENPYGFVPACWINHTPVGSIHGAPAVRTLAKIDELNGLASHSLDQAHRILEAPILVSGENIQAGGLSRAKAAQSGSSTTANADAAQQEAIKLITAGVGASMDTVRMEPGEALEHIDRMLREVEADHPELVMYTKLREMSTVSGPAADRLFGDVAGLVNAARTQYDRQVVKLCQMAVAIGGWRANEGGWGRLNGQQQRFVGFGLDSYDAGDLGLSIQARGLMPMTEHEQLELDRLRQSVQMETSNRTLHTENAPASIAARLRAMADATPVQAAT